MDDSLPVRTRMYKGRNILTHQGTSLPLDVPLLRVPSRFRRRKAAGENGRDFMGGMRNARPTQGKGLADTHKLAQHFARPWPLGHATPQHRLCPGLKVIRHSGKPGLFESVFHCVVQRRHSQREPPAWSSLLLGPEVGQGVGNSAHPLLHFAS